VSRHPAQCHVIPRSVTSSRAVSRHPAQCHVIPGSTRDPGLGFLPPMGDNSPLPREEPVKRFQVTMATNGRSFVVKEGESVLNAALRQGVMLPYSCKNGTCGSCKGKV